MTNIDLYFDLNWFFFNLSFFDSHCFIFDGFSTRDNKNTHKNGDWGLHGDLAGDQAVEGIDGGAGDVTAPQLLAEDGPSIPRCKWA